MSRIIFRFPFRLLMETGLWNTSAVIDFGCASALNYRRL